MFGNCLKLCYQYYPGQGLARLVPSPTGEDTAVSSVRHHRPYQPLFCCGPRLAFCFLSQQSQRVAVSYLHDMQDMYCCTTGSLGLSIVDPFIMMIKGRMYFDYVMVARTLCSVPPLTQENTLMCAELQIHRSCIVYFLVTHKQ